MRLACGGRCVRLACGLEAESAAFQLPLELERSGPKTLDMLKRQEIMRRQPGSSTQTACAFWRSPWSAMRPVELGRAPSPSAHPRA